MTKFMMIVDLKIHIIFKNYVNFFNQQFVLKLSLWLIMVFTTKLAIFVIISIWTMFTITAFTTSKGKLIVPIENNSSAFVNIMFFPSYMIPL